MAESVDTNRNMSELFEKPMCLIATDNDGHLEVVEDTVKCLEKIDSPLNVVAIAGLYRTGKSYLMNRLAGKTSGFNLGSSIESTTKGIWAWCRQHPTKPSQVLLLLDTEGLGDVKKTEMQALYDAFDKKNGDLLYEHCVGRIHEMHDKRIRTSIEKGKYAVAGGHALYKTDMQDLFDQYNKELNNVDFSERQRAQSDLQREVLSESEKIMTDDKSISEKEIQDSMAKQLETIKHDLLKTQEEEKKKFKEELENQGKQHKEEMETIRNEQRELEKANITKYNEEVLTRRDAQYDDLRRLAKLEAREELRKEDEERKKAEEREEQERQDRIRKEYEERMKNAQCVLS